MNSAGSPVGDVPFIRSGLLGFVGPVSDAFVFVWCILFKYVDSGSQNRTNSD